jgi:RNA polymerase primary sigma factor
MKESLRKQINMSLSTLSIREADIVSLFFGLNGKTALSVEEIADEFGLTRERVRQIKEKTIRMLRHRMRSKLLKQYLGQ